MERPGAPEAYRYPYLPEQTYNFFKEAIAQGAHKEPLQMGRVNRKVDLEKRLIDIRNMVGIYITSPATMTKVDSILARNRPGISTQMAIKVLLKHLWNNVDEETKKKFPIENLVIDKPAKGRKKQVRQFANAYLLDEAVDFFLEGGRAKKIAWETGIEEVEAQRLVLKAKKIVEEKGLAAKAYGLRARIEDLPPDFEGRQVIMDQITEGVIGGNSDAFVSFREVFKLLGMSLPIHNDAAKQAVAETLKEWGIAVGEPVLTTKKYQGKYKKRVIFREDFERIKKILSPAENS